MSELITMRHVRAAGFCAWGARRVCRFYKLDARRFFNEGLPASSLVKYDDALIKKVLEVAGYEHGK